MSAFRAIALCFLPSQRLTKSHTAAIGAAISETPVKPNPNESKAREVHAPT
jgi:hypothetical protein